MGKTTDIFEVNPVTVGTKQFKLDFEHRGGSGYWVAVTPWAKNTHPDAEDGALVVMGVPGMVQARIDDSPRYAKKVGKQLFVAAIYEAAGLIAKCMKDYRQNLFLTHAAVLSDMNGVDVELLTQVAQTYWPSCPPPVPAAPEPQK